MAIIGHIVNDADSPSGRSTSDNSTDALLQDILSELHNMSQSAVRATAASDAKSTSRSASSVFPRKKGRKSTSHTISGLDNILDEFKSGIKKGLLDSLGASEFQDEIAKALSGLAENLGVELDKVPQALGKELSKQLMDTDAGKAVAGKAKELMGNAMSNLKGAFQEGAAAGDLKSAIKGGLGKGSSLFKGSTAVVDAGSAAASTAEAAELAGGAASAAEVAGAAELAGGATAASGALGGVAAAAAAVAGPLLLVVGAVIILDKALETLTPAIEGTKEMFNTLKESANRYSASRKKNLEAQQKRIADTVNDLIEAPFNVLKDAANEMVQVWDSSLRTITATQGYSKADVQTLIGEYAQRLRDEDLADVVSAADITENLTKVLSSGLSGRVAEEFAYLATKLNAAVPTQDFFNYADTYASLAANAIQSGASEAEAIAYANQEIEQFASNVLYASRQLSGGFSSGLTDASQLFEYAVQIATSSKSGDVGELSGVLASVAAVTGAIAPDLASSLVEAVAKAAVGGNSSEIVALRSLAGINASNTAFLKALTDDPQAVFSELFRNLANMQNMSNDNFMEVAEGLSSVFGISMEAFARVDFNHLADAISQMNVNNASLDENMQLLVSGQTTSTAEQLRMAQINQYMIDEGLAYVLDNEVARSIQEHMWEEQLAREMTEAEYAVNLQGSALKFLEGIKSTVDNIINFLNPMANIKKVVSSLVATTSQTSGLSKDVQKVLELGVIGEGSDRDLHNLTTTNRDLRLTSSIVELLGGTSSYATSLNRYRTFEGYTTFSGLSDKLSSGYRDTGRVYPGEISSKYSWSNVSKSVAQAIASTPINTTQLSSTGISSTQAAIESKSTSTLQKFLDTMESSVDKNISFDEWAATAKSYGISDLSQALDDAGLTEEAVKGTWTGYEAQQAAAYKHEREVREDEFWKQGTSFYTNTQADWLSWEDALTSNQEALIAQSESILANTDEMITNQQSMIEKIITSNDKLANIYQKTAKFLDEWVNYYVKHTAYSEATMNSYKAADVINAEKKESGDAVLALAEALTQNSIGIKEGFKDPVVQTNVLLSKILLVAEAIMQQNNKTGGLSLADSLAGLSLGLTSQTP